MDGGVEFTVLHTAQEAGENVVTSNGTIKNALWWFGKIFLEDIETVFGNMTKFSRRMEQIGQLPAFKKFSGRKKGVTFRFVGLNSQIATELRENVPTALGPDVVEIVDIEYQTPP